MRKLILASLVCLGLFASAQASSIPYGNPGTFAPASSFVATGTGPITAYFYATNASYDSEIGLLVQNVSTGVTGLLNHSSNYGDMLVLGNANAGDVLVFKLLVLSSGDVWYTDPSLNSDGLNHAYSTAFAGDNIIPAGIYIGFEDLPGGGDRDYNDHQFVFTGVRENTPDTASTLAISGLALAALAFIRRKF